jgi:hypothetical protein
LRVARGLARFIATLPRLVGARGGAIRARGAIAITTATATTAATTAAAAFTLAVIAALRVARFGNVTCIIALAFVRSACRLRVARFGNVTCIIALAFVRSACRFNFACVVRGRTSILAVVASVRVGVVARAVSGSRGLAFGLSVQLAFATTATAAATTATLATTAFARLTIAGRQHVAINRAFGRKRGVHALITERRVIFYGARRASGSWFTPLRVIVEA